MVSTAIPLFVTQITDDVIFAIGRFDGTIEKTDGGIKVNGNKVDVF